MSRLQVRLIASCGAAMMVALGVFVVRAAAQQGPPAPDAEHKALEFLVGKWRYEGTVHATPFGKEGKATGTNSCDWFEGHFQVICRGEFTDPASRFTQMEIYGYKRAEHVFERFHIDSMGGSSRATATFDGKTFRWQGTATVDGKKTVVDFPLTETGADSFTSTITVTQEGEKPVVLEEARSIRIK